MGSGPLCSGYCCCGCGQKTSIPTYSHAARGWKKGIPLHYVHGHNRATPRTPSHLSSDGTFVIAYAKCGTPFWVSLRDRKLVDASRWIYADGYIRKSSVADTRSLHIILAGKFRGNRTDHKDRNTLDNRRTNLRPASHSHNKQNEKLRKDNKSGFKGVHAARSHGHYTGNWKAEICVNGQLMRLGTCSTKAEAARLYDQAAIKYFGEFACTNAMLGLL